MVKKWFAVLMLLSGIAVAQSTLPDAPSTSAEAKLQKQSGNSLTALTWSETFTGKGSRLFWTTHALLFGATIFDVEVTHQGLAHHQCVEHGEIPYPSRGHLYAHDMAFNAGVTVADILLRKVGVPWVPSLVAPSIGTYKHLSGGAKWLNNCW